MRCQMIYFFSHGFSEFIDFIQTIKFHYRISHKQKSRFLVFHGYWIIRKQDNEPRRFQRFWMMGIMTIQTNFSPGQRKAQSLLSPSQTNVISMVLMATSRPMTIWKLLILENATSQDVWMELSRKSLNTPTWRIVRAQILCKVVRYVKYLVNTSTL